MFDHARFNKLLHHDGRERASLDVFGQLHHLLLELVDLGVFLGLLGLFLLCRFLVSLDLGLGSAAF